ncbi:MAG: N-acetylglucosaminyldiphosphoundecaprenol N-acetyl-beta-D-mannosaminyltransferase [Solirubrobacteraceae bacterium]|nr:N-acetylglucosaminyldiphosphoundecaprenol N-acetyl-beta-D-mannosaminyltransferase [Solirubrobacteraceae bacterium]
MTSATGVAPKAEGRDTALLLGCRIDRVDMETTLRRARAAIDRREYVQHVCINAAKLVALQDDDELRRIVEGCGLVNADGQAVVWASRILGDPLPERVAGVDLMFELFALSERHGYRPYILGAAPDVLEQAVARLRVKHPRLDLAGWHDGYFPVEEHAQVAREIRDSGADILFVAISSPTKERFLGAYGATLGVPFVMGVGGAIDIVAGVTRRAPGAWQRLGLEWLYRLLQEPQRMFKRYATTNLRFLMLVARSLAGRSGR